MCVFLRQMVDYQTHDYTPFTNTCFIQTPLLIRAEYPLCRCLIQLSSICRQKPRRWPNWAGFSTCPGEVAHTGQSLMPALNNIFTVVVVESYLTWLLSVWAETKPRETDREEEVVFDIVKNNSVHYSTQRACLWTCCALSSSVSECFEGCFEGKLEDK